MTLRSPILVALVTVVLVLPLVAGARHLTGAREQLRSVQTSLSRTVADVNRVLALRGREQRVAEQKRPDQDVIARVNAALAGAEIPTSRFSGLRPHSDSPLPGADRDLAYRRQTVNVRLRQLTIAELGAFLETWTDTQDLWTATTLELSHVRNTADPARFDISILLSATYVADR